MTALNPDHQRLPHELIKDIQRAVNPPVMRSILNKVIRPNMVWPLRLQSSAEAVVQPKPPLLGLFL
ncbi:hypothetical protein Z949_411 [Sulfitobacter guttiformis KCTC 32187]|nr:hypothetical protein Z949_411 [Sulfitobacter guttiformis KCTC 32187]